MSAIKQQLLIALIMASSMFVAIEPAPFDIIAIITCGFLSVTQRGLISQVPILLELVMVFVFVRMVTLSFVDDIKPALLFFGITTYLSLAAYVLAAYVGRRGPRIIELIATGLYIGTIVNATAIVLAYAGVGVLADIVLFGNARAKGFFKDPNVLGPAMIPVAMLALAQLFKGRKRVTTLWYITNFSLASWLVFVSYSRGAWATYVAGLMVFTMLRILQEKGARAVITFVGIALVSGAAIYGALYLNQRGGSLEYASERLERQDYDEDRFSVQAELIDRASDNVLGHGPGSANTYSERVGAAGSSAAHSTYIRVLFEYGVVGIIVYSVLVCTTLYLALAGISANSNSAWVRAPLAASVIAGLISGVAVDTLHWRHLWILFGLVWGIAAWERDYNKSVKLHNGLVGLKTRQSVTSH